MEDRAKRATAALKVLGTCQVLSGVGAALSIFIYAAGDTLALAAEDIMVSGQALRLTGVSLMVLVVVSGAVSLLRVPWGWLLSFSVATVVLLMTLLMGPGTTPPVKLSFLGLMALSLLNWAAAVVSYFHDLYT